MTIRERIKSFFSPATVAPVTRAQSMESPGKLAGGRASIDTCEDVFRSALSVFTPFSADRYWRDYNLDSKTLDRLSVTKLMELLADLSPDVSKALWDFLRFCNPGYECKALRPGSDEVDARGQKAIDSFISNLSGPYIETNTIGLDVTVGSLFIGQFLRGALCAELVLDEQGRMPVDLATPDPATIKFKRLPHPVRGYVWQPGQYQGSQFVPMDRITFAYIPVDPFPGRPDGRAMAAPALFSCLFLIGMLHDLRRVVAQQGYPRFDIGINLDELKKLMPTDLAGNTAKVKEWVDKAISQIEQKYAELEPDDAFFHLDPLVKMNRPVGTLNADALGKVDAIIAFLERFTTRALKSMPLLMGTTDGVSEANANRQYEIHVAGIKSIQHLAENLLERLFTLALRVQGIGATVKFRFSELRAAELLRDAQTERLNQVNAGYAYDRGWISQDEAAMKGAGKARADVAEPRIATSTNSSGLASVQPDPGANRAIADDQTRNAGANALLLTAMNQPQSDEIDSAERFFAAAVPDAAGILSSESVS